jgi:hypothetical protein
MDSFLPMAHGTQRHAIALLDTLDVPCQITLKTAALLSVGVKGHFNEQFNTHMLHGIHPLKAEIDSGALSLARILQELVDADIIQPCQRVSQADFPVLSAVSSIESTFTGACHLAGQPVHPAHVLKAVLPMSFVSFEAPSFASMAATYAPADALSYDETQSPRDAKSTAYLVRDHHVEYFGGGGGGGGGDGDDHGG